MAGMKVMNIGIIIRNDHDDTFPVALTPQMVSVIQNLLTQIPVLNSKLVDGQGKKVAANASIPIIPRSMEFDWDRAYSPMMPEEEQKLMKEMQDKYAEDEANKIPTTEASDAAKTGGIIVPEGMGKDDDEDPEKKVTPLFKDKDNPFNMELNAEGRANVDIEAEKADDAETAGAEEETQLTEDHIEASEEEAEGVRGEDLTEEQMKEIHDGEAEEACGDCTVTPDALNLSGEQKSI